MSTKWENLEEGDQFIFNGDKYTKEIDDGYMLGILNSYNEDTEEMVHLSPHYEVKPLQE